MQVWHLLHVARLKIQGAKMTQKIAIWAPSHISSSGYIFTTKVLIDDWKKLLNSNISPICSYNMVNFCQLAAEIGPGVSGTPANISTVSRLGSVTARQWSSERQPNFAALTRGRHLCFVLFLSFSPYGIGQTSIFMVALCNRADHYIFILFLSSFFLLLFFSSPNLSGRKLDVYHTLTHGVALMRI